uniref:Uncharacterized protein n=1 Tax=Palpitomonas bilix TaxID=652834 RepID=A0A7S3D1M6_9EUKA|mmetsp:Transcript_17772/g.44085  ORF Transcript_17772/g.44085 Transcript_17772/m.44085 type:complete len:132 (+) Transcript_17772:63-458(+)
MAESDDLLYGDFADMGQGPSAREKELEKEVDRLKALLQKAVAQLKKVKATTGSEEGLKNAERMSALEKAVIALKAKNTQLEKNISSLYRTAQAEIERKNKQIDELRRGKREMQGDSDRGDSRKERKQARVE